MMLMMKMVVMMMMMTLNIYFVYKISYVAL